jgi:hypothetical protein
MRPRPASIARGCLALALGAASWACAPSSVVHQEPAQRPGPHGGSAVDLPDGLGCVECQLETEAGARVRPEEALDRRGRPRRTVIAVYFLASDARSARAPAPSAARLRVVGDAHSPREIRLEPKPRPGDPAGSARFASPPGAHAPRSLRGKLVATVDGREVTAPLYLR